MSRRDYPLPTAPPAVLNLRAAATYLGISHTQLYRVIDAGEIPVVKVTEKRRVIRIVDLDDFLAARLTVAGDSERSA